MTDKNDNDEARFEIQTLKRNARLGAAVGHILADLGKVSTFDCIINGSPKSATDLIAELSAPESAGLDDCALYSLHLLSVSQTRYEEFNNQELSLSALRLHFNEKLARMSSFAPNGTLLETAILVKGRRENLATQKVIYQSIDGATRRRDELVMDRVRSMDLPDQMRKAAAELAAPEGDFLSVVTPIANDLIEKTKADFVLLTGPVRDLSSCVSPTTEDFFSYVFAARGAKIANETLFENGYQWAQSISNVFRGASIRYHNKGYQPLMPGIAINEDNRPEHRQIGLTSMIRGPGSLFGRNNQFDLRCGLLSSGRAFDAGDLNLLLDKTEILSPVIEKAIGNAYAIPKFNLSETQTCARGQGRVPLIRNQAGCTPI